MKRQRCIEKRTETLVIIPWTQECWVGHRSWEWTVSTGSGETMVLLELILTVSSTVGEEPSVVLNHQTHGNLL